MTTKGKERRSGCFLQILCTTGMLVAAGLAAEESGIIDQVRAELARGNSANGVESATTNSSITTNEASVNEAIRKKYEGVYFHPGEFLSNPTEQQGLAHWYSYEEESGGGITGCGEVFDPYALTAASWFYDCGTKLEVTNVENGSTVVVYVNDRGPNRVDYPGVIIDLSKGSFDQIAELGQGQIKVRVARK